MVGFHRVHIIDLGMEVVQFCSSFEQYRISKIHVKMRENLPFKGIDTFHGWISPRAMPTRLFPTTFLLSFLTLQTCCRCPRSRRSSQCFIYFLHVRLGFPVT